MFGSAKIGMRLILVNNQLDAHFFSVYIYFDTVHVPSVPGSSVGITTGYGLDGPEIEFRWARGFPHLSRPALVPT